MLTCFLFFLWASLRAFCYGEHLLIAAFQSKYFKDDVKIIFSCWGCVANVHLIHMKQAFYIPAAWSSDWGTWHHIEVLLPNCLVALITQNHFHCLSALGTYMCSITTAAEHLVISKGFILTIPLCPREILLSPSYTWGTGGTEKPRSHKVYSRAGNWI